ncbi:MAG: S8 family serine peptidase [Intrasporangium sp.]|uniref:S8 family serine peptidase n=1 Tax=Intrasporangium sp. TaxID=1925024 RepID=UPI00264733EB|nr:S8 family serine peptidase [Intrasporangium sp.]MDN5794802.1 S8 family serine peptidase [Intrasporangium sp.]
MQDPPTPRSRSLTRRALGIVATACLVITGSLGAATASAAAPSPADDPTAKPVPVTKATLPASLRDKMAGSVSARKGPRTVFVELTGQGAADAASAARGQGKDKAAQRAAARAARLAARDKAAAVVKTAKGRDSGARELYQIVNTVPAVVMRGDAAAIRAVAGRSDVVAVRPIVPKKVTNAGAAQLTRVLDEWQQTGRLGDGVTVGVIDTGIDFTHADFGGVGTRAAYEAALEVSDSEAGAAWRDPLPPLAKTKLAGGWDFVGNDYDADPDSPDYQPVPHPDANPLDCNEHGTHVSGTVAGYGVDADGSTFTGDYRALTGTDLYGMQVGPGMAPKATLYGLKVFGCAGSTDVVSLALDRALDPNGDGDFSDRLDIVNLSLGSDYATVDDPENLVVDNLAKHGVLPVIAMGNAGDLTDVGGSPGNAVRSLAVASSVDQYQLLSGIKVNAPPAEVGTAAGQTSVAYDWANEPDVTGDVVALSEANADGCDPLDGADAAAVAGKVAWLTWDSDDSTRRCGSAGRAANVKKAGAIGALFTGDVAIFASGISGDPDIPVFQLTLKQTQRLQAAVDAGTLDVTFTKDLLNAVQDVDPSIADLPSSFTSRGPHGSIGVVKPDVAAPGDTIASAAMGTGDGVSVLSGTSMATPHTAGIAALVKQSHSTWTSEQLKAAIMNTAGHDLWTDPNQSGTRFGPARVGVGRVDALAAVGTKVLAYAEAGSGGVSASFGVVEAPVTRGLVTARRTITLQNTGTTRANLSLRYEPIVTQPGVGYSVRPARVTLRPGQTRRVVVTMTVRPTALRHTIDPTMQAEQIGLPRQFVSDASGRVLVSGASAQPLRVPVYGAAKPTSSTRVFPLSTPRRDTLRVIGTGIDQGSGASAYTSLLSVLELGATSPRLPTCKAAEQTGCTVNQTAQGGDLKYVGANATDEWLWFGLATWGNSATIGNTMIPYVDFDVNGDKESDYEAYVQNYPGTDVLFSVLVDLESGEAIDLQPVNFQFGDIDANVFDTDVVLVPVLREALTATKGSKVTYSVGTFSPYTNNSNGDIDEVGPVTFDSAKPAIGVDSELFLDARGTIPVTRTGAPAAKDTGKGQHPKPSAAQALVIRLHGASGSRAQVVRFR